MNPLPGVVTLAAALTAGGCAYYNAMWSAEHQASDARRLEQSGQVSEARAAWTQAANKARTVVQRHPHSRWAGDALVLEAEALARSGACEDAAEPIARALENARDAAHRERVDLAAAECALAAGRAVAAEAALTTPLTSGNADRRSQAEYLAGQAAALRMDYDSALDHFSRSREAGAPEQAFVAQQRGIISRARSRRDLSPVALELTRRLGTERGTDDRTQLLALVNRVMAVPETPAARFHQAEVARDSLQAPVLAGYVFLDAAASDTASLYTPKALIAALALLPDRHDSIVVLLDSRYASSPYTRAFHGEPSVAYAAAEDSLARDLGVPTSRSAAVPAGVSLGWGVPLPGPRGPRP
jgi:tetratricopeptide (TPR) repeat protein